jgi:glutamine synthetase
MSTTALDTHRQVNATSPLLAETVATIAERGVQFVYFQAITITGRVVGKVAPARHFERLAVKGVQQHQTAVANLQGTRDGVLLAGGVNAPEYTAVPDLDTFAILPWDPTTCSRTPGRPSPATPGGCCCACIRPSPTAPGSNCAPAVNPR